MESPNHTPFGIMPAYYAPGSSRGIVLISVSVGLFFWSGRYEFLDQENPRIYATWQIIGVLPNRRQRLR